MKKAKHYKRVVDNKMRWQGDTDTAKKIIRVNKKKSKAKTSIIDTIYHEEYHAAHPNASEKKTYAATKRAMATMTPKDKKKYYSAYA